MFGLVIIGVLYLVLWSLVSPVLLYRQWRHIVRLTVRLEALAAEREAEREVKREAAPRAVAEPAAEPPPVPEPAVTAAAAQPEPAAQPELEPAAPTEEAPAAAPPPAWRRPAARPTAADLEVRLGGRLAVWLGGVALALAGAFLVKYSIEQGLLTPALRVAAGVLFGLGLLGGGAWMHRRDRRVAAAMVAAGIAALYAAFYAGTSLYDLFDPAIGFALLVTTTTAAELLALRHGRGVAQIGLVGGFVTPLLVQSGAPRPELLFGYLFLLVCGLTLVGVRRPWPELVGLGLAGAFAWGLLWILGGLGPGDDWVIGAFVLAVSGLAALAAPRITPLAVGDLRITGPGTLWAAAGLASGTLLMLAAESGFGGASLAALWLLGLGALVIGRQRPSFDLLPWLTAAVTLLALAAWGWEDKPDWVPATVPWAFALFAALYGLGGFAALFGAARPQRWASLSAAFGMLVAPLAYAKAVFPLGDLGWGFLGLGVAAAHAGAAAWWVRYRVPELRRDGVLAAFAAAAAGLVALSVAVVTTQAWLGPAWAATVAGFAWVHRYLPIVTLRRLAAALAVVVVLVVLTGLPPGEVPRQLGGFPGTILHILLPALALAVAAWLIGGKRADRPTAQVLDSAAATLGFAWIYWAIRLLFPNAMTEPARWNGFELGLVTCLWLLYALGLGALGRRIGRGAVSRAAQVAAGLALLFLLLGPVLLLNPMRAEVPVGGWPVLNALVLLYAVPAGLLPAAARLLPWSGRPRFELAKAAALFVLGALFVTLEVRQFFAGSLLQHVRVGDAEFYTYSAVSVAAGLLLLGIGIWRDSRPARAASLLVIALAAGKVFLYDTAALTGLYRVFSFLGLGFSLLAIGYAFQRFVAAPARKTRDPSEEPG